MKKIDWTLLIICIAFAVLGISAFAFANYCYDGDKYIEKIEQITEQRNRLSDCVRFGIDNGCLTEEEVELFIEGDVDSLTKWVYSY